MSQLTARFQNIFDLNIHNFDIVGCGAIGSYTAMALVRAGATRFTLWDFDTVATVNIGVQHYNLNHVGKVKTLMLMKQMQEINPRCTIKPISKRFGEQSYRWNYRPTIQNLNSYNIENSIYDNIICFILIGVDSMSSREEIANRFSMDKYYSSYDRGYDRFDTYYIDARMGSETFQMDIFYIPKIERTDGMNDNAVETIAKERMEVFRSQYFETWYSDDDGDSEPCNSRSTNYCASMSAAFINNQVRKIVDERSPINPSITFNFPSMTLLSNVDMRNIIS